MIESVGGVALLSELLCKKHPWDCAFTQNGDSHSPELGQIRTLEEYLCLWVFQRQ